jgi:hypothetical protein
MELNDGNFAGAMSTRNRKDFAEMIRQTNSNYMLQFRRRYHELGSSFTLRKSAKLP